MSKKSYAVLGLGRFGASVAKEMSKAGAEVLAVDMDEDRVHELASIVTCAVKADVCDAETMGSLGLSNMDGVVVAVTENLDASIMGTILAKEAGVEYVIAKAKDAVHAKILEKVGADKVIIPEKESGIRIARSMMSGKFLDFIELSDRVTMIEVPVKEEWVGKSLKELDLRRVMNINVIAVRREDDEVVININPDELLKEGTSLYITVDRNDIRKLV